MFKPKEIHKFTQDNGVFNLVVGRYNLWERAREWGRKSGNMAEHNVNKT